MYTINNKHRRKLALSCWLKGERAHKWIDDGYGEDGNFKIYKCKKCHWVHVPDPYDLMDSSCPGKKRRPYNDKNNKEFNDWRKGDKQN